MRKPQYKANESSVYITRDDCVSRYCLSRVTIDRLAAECGAKVKIGRNARYDRQKLDAYISSMSSNA